MPKRKVPHKARTPKSARPTKYKFPLEHYCQLYEIPFTTILSWYRKNLALDDPEKLLQEVLAMKAKKPTNLTKLNELAKGPLKKPTPPPKAPAPSVSATPPASSAPPPPGGSHDAAETALEGFQRELERLKNESDVAYRSYQAEEDPLLKTAWWKMWKDMLDAWGKLAKLAPDAEREAGNVMRVGDVESIWARATQEVRVVLDSHARRMSMHATFRSLDPVDVEQTILADLKQVMTIMEQCKFADEDSQSS